MATATVPPAPLRRELGGTGQPYAYELHLLPRNGVTLRVEENARDAAVFMTSPQILELRADLAHMYLMLNPIGAPGAIRSPAAFAIVEHLRQAFMALIELDKAAPEEVNAVTEWVLRHVKAWRPYLLAEGQAVLGG